MKIPRLFISSLILAATLLGCGKKLEEEKTTPENLTLAVEAETLWKKAGKGDAAALTKLRALAEKGDAKAQNNLGRMYDEGLGVPKDEDEAVKWYREAADQGHADAQNSLGVMYRTGLGVPKDEVEGVKWYRKAADQGYAAAQYNLGKMYIYGFGVTQDEVEAVKWYREAADQGHAVAQNDLGVMYERGQGVTKDVVEAVKWFRKAADQGYAFAQINLGKKYAYGHGVTKDEVEAVKWYRKAADQGNNFGQYNLGVMYERGQGVTKDEVEAYKWYLLVGVKGKALVEEDIDLIEKRLTPAQRAEGQRLAREWKPGKELPAGGNVTGESIATSRPTSSGTGFFITDDGYFVTNQHVAGEGATVRIVTAAGAISAKVVKVDKANDLTLLKAERKFVALPVAASRGVRLGATVATVGFPNIGLQGFSPKLAKGEIGSLAGARDDARHFQISVPIQPGNSGGALVDERGNVVGVVVAKLNQRAAIATSGTLAENVNYAVKSSYLLSFLESVPEIAEKLKEPNVKERKFEDVVKDTEKATVLVLVY